MDYIREKLAIIEDSRHSGYVEHNLADVLIIVMCAVMCGLDGLAEIMVYAASRAAFIKKKFGIGQIPSKSTVSRILNMVDGDAVAKVIIEIMLEILDVAGKTITADAMHCQKGTCSRIMLGKGNYVFGLKGNQKTLHDDVELFIK